MNLGAFEASLTLPTPCQLLDVSALTGIPLWIKRDDLLHPVVAGNKYRKLKYTLAAIEAEVEARLGTRLNDGVPSLVTMGGIWSNHVHATAYAAAALGYHSRALLRAHVGMDSAMLADCRQQGMQLQFLDRVAYRRLREEPDFWRSLVPAAAHQFWLPEGGSSAAAVRGVAELVAELPFIPDVIVVACATGATLAGLLAGLGGRSQVLGIAVLNQAEHLAGDVSRLLTQAGFPDYQNFQILQHWHHGGYAKTSPALRQFCDEFNSLYQVPIEPVYTGKALFALRALVQAGSIQTAQRVMLLHTGGLQGARGLVRS